MVKVIQAWDDGLVDDIRVAGIMNRCNAKATFCLNPGLHQTARSFGWTHNGREVWRLGIHELRRAYDGFEICSHSMTHPFLTDLTDDQLYWEVAASRSALEDIFNRPVLGFCYPFNTYNERVVDSVRSAGYRWARGNQHRENIFPPADPFQFHPSCHFLDTAFWTKYAHEKRHDGVFFFWGHSCELTDEVLWGNFANTIERISSDPDARWLFVKDLFEPPAQS